MMMTGNMVKIKTKVNVKDIKENKGKVFWIILISISFVCLAFAFTHDAEQEIPSETQQEIPQETTTYKINDTEINISVTQKDAETGLIEMVSQLFTTWLPIWFLLWIGWGIVKKW
jgi:hypothetical protein